MVGANDHCVLGLEGIEPERTGEISCECNWCVIGYVVPIIQSWEKCRAINCGSNCVNLPKRYRNKLKTNIEGHLGHLHPFIRCGGEIETGRARHQQFNDEASLGLGSIFWVAWPWHRRGHSRRVMVTCVTCPYLLTAIMYQVPSNLIGLIIWSSGGSQWAFLPTYTIRSSAAVRLIFFLQKWSRNTFNFWRRSKHTNICLEWLEHVLVRQ